MLIVPDPWILKTVSQQFLSAAGWVIAPVVLFVCSQKCGAPSPQSLCDQRIMLAKTTFWFLLEGQRRVFGWLLKRQRTLDTDPLCRALSNLCDRQSQCSGINNCLLCLSPREMIAGVTARQERSRKPKALYRHVAEGEIRAEPGHRVIPNSVFNQNNRTIFKGYISSSTCRSTLNLN